MSAWSPHPIIYQINTAVWLNTLSRQYKTPITLANVPNEVLQELVSYHMDAIWLMGIWHRGEQSRASALNYAHEYRHVLNDLRDEDIIGSAYAIGGYHVPETFGGKEGLAVFRERLHAHHVKLIADFVPNHTGKDHVWLKSHPEYYVQGTPELLENDPKSFFSVTTEAGETVIIANGRDPYFPSWIDTAQLNAFSAGYRQAAIETLLEIADCVDGVRCDMAMLMMDDVFHQTWGWRGAKPLEADFWTSVISSVKAESPHFLFIAETYWGLEYALHLEGFDYTYDKTLYDRVLEGNVDGLYAHLSAHISFLKKNIRFIENHDEPRAAASLGVDRSRPAAALISTLPGGVLLHDGQFVGRKLKLPVQITRQPNEYEYSALKRFYMSLLEEVSKDIYRYGDWTLFRRSAACAGCTGHHNIIAYGWHWQAEYRLIVLNLVGVWSQATIDLSAWDGIIKDYDIQAYNVLTRTYADYSGADWVGNGLNVELDPYSVNIFDLKLTPKRVNMFSAQY